MLQLPSSEWALVTLILQLVGLPWERKARRKVRVLGHVDKGLAAPYSATPSKQYKAEAP